MKNSFLTFKGNGSFTLGLANDRQWDGKVEHSTDGTSWVEWDGKKIKSAASGEDHFLYLRGKNKHFSEGGYYNTTFVLDGNATEIECTGNIMSLLDYESPDTAKMDDSCFCGLFSSCSKLTKAPDLPATELSESCYEDMFEKCTGLTEAPELPATVLAEYCYQRMFKGCTGLTECPALPATELAEYCYFSMFVGCTGLTKTPELPATVLARSCYGNMFLGCSSLTSIGKIAGGNPVSPEIGSLNFMFFDCTSLNVVKKKEDPFVYIPGILGRYLFRKMFRNCKNNPKEKPGNAFKI